jgi:oxygen-independent coproporphyrinogen-3 oxidase
MAESPIAVYLHIPFCPTKCGYCDFNSYAGLSSDLVAQTVEATLSEVARSPYRGRPAKTIFFGGGTPTYLEAAEEVRLLEAVVSSHPPIEGCEITTEANPGTVDASKFSALKAGGFNRISLGAQSFLDGDLVRLGRVHASGEIERAVLAAREGGFANVNLDLMFGLPGQTPRAWRSNLDRALALKPDHLSLYGLTIEPNTAFYKERQRGQLLLPDEDMQVEMYEAALSGTKAAGMIQYEISNFAKPGRECLHNVEYWRGRDYAGYGPGAVGCVDGTRYTNWKHPERYVSAVTSNAPVFFEAETLTPESRRLETIMLGLRLNAGLPRSSAEIDPLGLARVVQRGWVEASEELVRLTDAGRHFASEVALALA